MSLSTHYGSYIRPLGIACPCSCARKPSASPEEGSEDEIADANMRIYRPNLESCDTVAKAHKVFDDFKAVVTQLTHFPPEESRFLQLMYYANLSDKQSPYTKSAQLTFQRSYISDRDTKTWLRVGGVTAWSSPVVTWALPLLGWAALSLTQDHPGVAAAIVTAGVAASGISWISTGSNPDYKSDSANERQDVLTGLPETLKQIARELIDLKYDRPFLAAVTAYALQMNLDNIQKQMILEDPKSQESPLDLTALAGACRAVLGGERPDRMPVDLSAYILGREIQAHLLLNRPLPMESEEFKAPA